MTSTHRFLLVSSDASSPHFFQSLKWNPLGTPLEDESSATTVVNLPHELLLYMNDTLQWIQAIDPHSGSVQTGLGLFGYHVVPSSASEKAADLFSTWHRLFEIGPDFLVLAGDRISTEDNPFCEDIRLSKSDTLDVLGRLSRLFDQAAKESHLSVLHVGI